MDRRSFLKLAAMAPAAAMLPASVDEFALYEGIPVGGIPLEECWGSARIVSITETTLVLEKEPMPVDVFGFIEWRSEWTLGD